MLMSILRHTPVFVWLILAALVWRGWSARRDREVAARKLAIIPLVLLALSLWGVLSAYASHAVTLPLWLAGVLAGTFVASRLVRGEVAVLPERAALLVRGSWVPMVVLVTMFLLKYVTNVALAIQPALAANASFANVSCALSGLLSGALFGNALPYLLAYRNSTRAAALAG